MYIRCFFFLPRSSYNSFVRIHLSTTPQRAEAGDPWQTGFLAPVCTLRCDGKTLQSTAIVGKSLLRNWDDPLEALRWMAGTFWPGGGRWIGYLSYDLGRLFENIPATARDELALPLFVFTYCRTVQDRPASPEPEFTLSDSPLQSNFPRERYLAAVEKAMEFIAAGDVFQVNLSQRFTCGLPMQPSIIYQRLFREHPAQYGAYLAYENFALICNSPELFFHVTPDRRIVTRPIKGTRPLLPGMEAELRESAKDQAELNMIIDLERNDLGRVCQVGSVKVSEPRQIEAHPTVYHGVAAIEGILRDDVNFVDLLHAVFPGGSITGAPKIRAMQIIEELEQTRRGPYCGAIGYLDSNGSMQFNVAIRTMIVKDSLAYVPVGGGIVADSDPLAEYEETLTKARAMLWALGIQPPTCGKISL
jgi:anthranilate/para-aminobenzoate synthase component I